MKISILTLGSPSVDYVQKGEQLYLKRLKSFAQCSLDILSTKKISAVQVEEVKRREADMLIQKLDKSNAIKILLDEHGKEITSKKMANIISDIQLYEGRDIIFIIGGAYGVDGRIKQMVDKTISLSKLTLPHQLVRLLFLEQLYRAFTIIKGLPYHHE